jgi:hypothetical protein
LEELELIGNDDLENIYNVLKKEKKACKLSSEERASFEKRVKEELALEGQFYKKDNKTLDLSKIKLPIFKKAMGICFEDKPNQLEADLSTQEEYIKKIKGDSGIKDLAKSLQVKLSTEKDFKKSVKDSLDSLKESYPKEIVEAVSLLIDKELKDSDTDKKPQKDTLKIFKLMSMIKKRIQTRH